MGVIMKTSRLTTTAGAMLLIVGLSACTHSPTRTADRTPSWQRYEVLGSRITRRVDASGQPDSANYTVVTSAAELSKMPAVKVSNRRR